ncbi:RinA family protein [Fructobacillus tropaeoli]|uniref:RinA family protein n=1 Tax=Fructobacillus tropaeoli TaxID=709323 RepID=UPI001EF26EB9|nr:RinA family protein [Fructobacillus tropaeoli]
MTDLADTAEQYFKCYYSGKWQHDLAWRIRDLKYASSFQDENVGGGRVKNVNTTLDSTIANIAKVEDDEIVRCLRHKIETVRNYEFSLDEYHVKLLKLRYGRERHTWISDARRLYKSVRQCQKDLKAIKKDFTESVLFQPVENLTP